jgi:FkbM family methyltransferase
MWGTLDRLYAAGFRSPVALFANAACAWKAGNGRNFSVDAEGDWVNRQKLATFVSRTIHAARYTDVRRLALDYWCHSYTPGEGDTVFDIGAGTGDEAVIFSHLVGSTGRVFSIEAQPRTFTVLEKTIAASGLANVTPLHLALADKDGTLRISSDQHHLANTVIDGDGDVEVPARALETLCSELGIERIDFLKMNIEGAERFAVKGFGRVAISHLAIACHDFIADGGGGNLFRSKADVLGYLQSAGYKVSFQPDSAFPWIRDTIYADLQVQSGR